MTEIQLIGCVALLILMLITAAVLKDPGINFWGRFKMVLAIYGILIILFTIIYGVIYLIFH